MGGIEQAKEDTMNAIESISTTSNQTESASEELARSTEKQLQAVEVLNLSLIHILPPGFVFTRI